MPLVDCREENVSVTHDKFHAVRFGLHCNALWLGLVSAGCEATFSVRQATSPSVAAKKRDDFDPHAFLATIGEGRMSGVTTDDPRPR